MKTQLPFFLFGFLVGGLIFFALANDSKSFAQSGTGSKTSCRSVDFPIFTFSEKNIFPQDKSLRRPEDGKDTAERGAEELFGVLNGLVDSGAVFYLRASGDEVKTPAIEASSNLYFANGIALDCEEKYLYVAETAMNRVLRYEISAGKDALTNREIYQSVITPDNIEFDQNGNLWIASPISNKVFAVDRRCRSLHTVFSAPSVTNAKMMNEWIMRSHLSKPLLELFSAALWNPLPGALTGMFWSRDYKTFYVTGLGNAILKYE